MPKEELFKTEESRTRAEIAETLVSAAEQIETGSVHLKSAETEHDIALSESLTFGVELERLTDSETGEER